MATPTPRTRLAAYGRAMAGGKVLLARASARSAVPGSWWLPGGGVRFGEHPAEAVVREFAEETGLEVTVVRLLDLLSDVTERPEVSERLQTVRAVYEVEVIGGELRPEVGGSTDVAAWVPAAETGALPVMPFFRTFLART